MEKIITTLQNSEKRIYIGISGIPGSGKSTFSNELNSKIPNSIIIPLDGYHKYLKELNEEQVYYRGRVDTFNLVKFKEDLLNLIENPNEVHYFPSFEHSIKDPFENDIQVNLTHSVVIFEGLYLFLRELDIDKYFDYKIFLTDDVDKAMERIALRNFNAGITNSLEDSLKRTQESDLQNAYYVLNNSNIDYTYQYIKS
jgi:pantothenate kinase